MARAAGREGRGVWLLALSAAGPIVLLVAAVGTRLSLLSAEVGYDVVAQRVTPWLAVAGVAAAALLAVGALRRQVSAVFAIAAVVIALGFGGFTAWRTHAPAGPGEDVSTDTADAPGFGILTAERGMNGPARIVGPEACPGAVAAPTQSLPEAVVYEMQARGIEVRRAGVTGVYGVKRTPWFGFTYDVVARIRPGRTDIRVAARDGRDHGGEACRIASALSLALRGQD